MDDVASDVDSHASNNSSSVATVIIFVSDVTDFHTSEELAFLAPLFS